MASYGGGHVQSLIPVARRLSELSEIDLEVIGFTTARAAFVSAGIQAKGYCALLDGSDEGWIELARKHKPKDSHPDIAEDDSLAYYALGLKDLIAVHGEQEAMAMYQERGRKAFLPIATFKRFLSKIKAELVITSTSPRSELALQYAASDLGIAGLAISDLFLQNESSYVCTSRYAKHITVIAEYVSEFLIAKGCDAQRLNTVGNPAFDRLFDEQYRNRAAVLREELGITKEEKIVLWVCPSADVSMIGKPFVKAEAMVAFLEDYCSRESNTRYLVRQHPNNPLSREIPHRLRYGILCPQEIDIETCIHAVDVVLLETSTVGLQAALLEKPVVTVNAGDYPPYAKLGLSVDASGLVEAGKAIRAAVPSNPRCLGYRNHGHSTDVVVHLVETLVGL